ncbi:MAG TPA: histidine kinase dimerization/phospho-acceptor domain-containing protein [Candidatus Binataceae bacterium]|nr:histidine kinase dimerization/phospho-acceptor domain-containing protein [Candidatus Binataceae bacterium]
MTKKSNNERGGAVFDPSAGKCRETNAAEDGYLPDLSGRCEGFASLRYDLAQKDAAPPELPGEAIAHQAIHDLRNEIGAIAGFAEILLDEAPPNLTAEHREILRQIKSAGETMLQLLDDLSGD